MFFVLRLWSKIDVVWWGFFTACEEVGKDFFSRNSELPVFVEK